MSAKGTKTKNVLYRLIVVLSALLLILVAVCIIYGLNHRDPAGPTSELSSAVPPETTDPPATEETISALQDAAKLPPDMEKLLAENHISYRELENYNCAQLITVVSNGTTARIRFFSREGKQWTELSQLACDGYVGRSGVFPVKKEGDGSTPQGLYSIGNAFYIEDMPQTGLDSFRITPDTYWVDDPASMFYNQRVEGTENKDWNSAEQMYHYDEYRYGFVIDYNTVAAPYAGSAIFFHINDNPTAGCIATNEEMVLAYLSELSKEKNPYILIS